MRGRKPINLEPYKHEIERLINNGSTQVALLDSLRADHGLVISKTTLQTALRDWRGDGRAQRVTMTQELKDKMKYFFENYDVTDQRVQSLLATAGFGHVGERTIRRHRKALGIDKRLKNDYEVAEHEAHIRQLLTNEFNDGRIEDMGRNSLYRHMRKEYKIIGRDRMYTIVKELYPQGVARRLAKVRTHRGHLKTPGPNHSWSMDAYCKLEQFGIQIYGIIDVYSRKIVSLYVGTTGRTAVSVLAQYVNTIEAGGVMPLIIRTDRGAETPLAADAHYMISCSKRTRHDGTPPAFSECFRFGTSKQNSRIETWWYQSSGTTMSRWRGHFIQLKDSNEYIRDNLGDRIAFLAIYMPIIRTELVDFCGIWNTHRIRKQPSRPYAIYGVPELMYQYPDRPEGNQEPGEQCGVPIEPQDVAELKQDLEAFDINEYLPPETLNWCEEFLEHSGFSLPILGGDYRHADGEKVHNEAYLLLRDACREHVRSGALPVLNESEKPYHARNWQPSATVQQVFADAGEDLPLVDNQEVDELQAVYGT